MSQMLATSPARSRNRPIFTIFAGLILLAGYGIWLNGSLPS